jgi:hypothetical protein
VISRRWLPLFLACSRLAFPPPFHLSISISAFITPRDLHDMTAGARWLICYAALILGAISICVIFSSGPFNYDQFLNRSK